MNQKYVKVNNLKFAIIATDVVLFTLHEDRQLVRLIPVIRSSYYPHHQGLPGGLVHPDETTEQAAHRLLVEKAGITSPRVHLEQLATFSKIDRDPRGRVVAVAYLGLIPWGALSSDEQSNAQAQWVDVEDVAGLAYDHDEVLSAARSRLTSRATYTTLLSKLMPSEFSLTELERAYEIVTGRKLDKRNFRKKIEKLGVLKRLNQVRTGVRARPAQLYTFAKQNVIDIEVL